MLESYIYLTSSHVDRFVQILLHVNGHFYETHKLAYQCSLFVFTDETQYRLRDPTTEKAMNCVLEDSLKRAQTKKLFEVQYH